MEAYFFMQILEMTSNIILRLFEKVPEGLQGSDFVWRAKIEKYSHVITSLEAIIL